MLTRLGGEMRLFLLPGTKLGSILPWASDGAMSAGGVAADYQTTNTGNTGNADSGGPSE
jgi:hypothetical protein